MERPPMERALSTDVLMDIVLSHLHEVDLLSCREVSKFWNKAASSVLRRRSTRIKKISKTKTLTELGECLKQSSDFPFAGLIFDQPWRLDSASAMKFLKSYGTRFTSLSLGICSETRPEDIATFINRLPRLSILEVCWSNLVPPPAESSDSAAGQEDSRILSLPSLRTLRMLCRLKGVLREVCTAASPSLRIECPWTSYRILRALKSVGKLQAVSVMNVNEDEDEKDYALRVDKLLSTESPALTKLDFEAGGCISRKGLMKLLISSQHTLRELSLAGVCPSELSSECPVLAKLTTLSISIKDSYKYLFQGSHGHKFPALTELELDYSDFECEISDGLFIVPTVTRIDVDGLVGTDQMKQLAKTFPNVVAIGLRFKCYYDEEELAERGEKSVLSRIWSVREFKQLEKLRIWDFVATPPANHDVNMDSFLTGIPFSICKNLQQQEPDFMRNLIKSPFGEKFSEVIRESPNILQLKNLKELIVCIRLEDGLEGIPKEPTFMTMVSVLYALEMMPNLEAKFVYDYSSLIEYFEDEDREEAVTLLKAAFKDVQPYVKLEPFFY